MIEILNLRLGIATNSSSSHSLVFFPRVHGSNEHWDNDETVKGSFGREDFVLADKIQKMHYLGIILDNALLGIGSPSQKLFKFLANQGAIEDDESVNGYRDDEFYKAKVFKELVGMNPPVSGYDTYIDHQSLIPLPVDYFNREVLDFDFWQALRDFVASPGVHILGGDDEHGPTDPGFESSTFRFPMLYMRGVDVASSLVARFDPKGNYWAIFDAATGSKMRFSWGDIAEKSLANLPINESSVEISPSKAFFPELVDICITYACPYEHDCPFCYMGATANGQVSDFSYVKKVLDILSAGKVFEIAIGGGEPTLHPNFLDILKYAKSKGILPNFTTKNLSWLKNKKKRTEIFDNCGAFAYSVQSAQDVEKLAQMVSKYDIPIRDFYGNTTKVNLHLVMGTVTREAFKAILIEAEKSDFRVTLLGYKTSGRGASYLHMALDYGWWLDVIEELYEAYACPAISVDTVLASEYDKELKKRNVPDFLYHTQDGKYSAYIDAVTMKLGPSSYCEDLEKISLPLSGDIVQDRAAFQSIWETF